MDLCTHTGLKEDMEKLEREFLNGTYTPFTSVPTTVPPTPKRKRSKVGKNMYNYCLLLSRYYVHVYPTAESRGKETRQMKPGRQSTGKKAPG